jgi:hypothetical protein
MNRVFSPHATQCVKTELSRLLEARADVPSYRTAMTALGRSLGHVLARVISHDERVIVACGVEDADYVAAGVVEMLENHVGSGRLYFACFWNARVRTPVEQAPIVRQYLEPHPNSVPHVVMVKSIISTSCAVRTNLVQLLGTVTPKTIHMAAPVIHRDAPINLKRELDPATARKIRYAYFAKDSERDADRMIVPGVGGSVYKLLGLGDEVQKNSISPGLVTARRLAAERPSVTAAS